MDNRNIITHTGDLTLESVKSNESIIVTDGSLTVLEQGVEDNARIELLITPEYQHKLNMSRVRFTNTVTPWIVNGVKYGEKRNDSNPEEIKFPELVIKGDVGDDVVIKSDAQIKIAKNIGKRCKITSPSSGIIACDVASDSIINVHGKVQVNNVDQYCSLTSDSDGVIINGVLDSYCKINAKYDISISEATWSHCTIVSEVGRVSTKDIWYHSSITAKYDVIAQRFEGSQIESIKGNVSVESLGAGVTIKADGDITINNTSHADDKLISKRGRAIRDDKLCTGLVNTLAPVDSSPPPAAQPLKFNFMDTMPADSREIERVKPLFAANSVINTPVSINTTFKGGRLFNQIQLGDAKITVEDATVNFETDGDKSVVINVNSRPKK